MTRTAAIVIIGNEILTGKVVDENTPFLTRQLWHLGVTTRRVVVVPDDVEVIAHEVSLAAASHDLVFTSGGVGPTHDDVTMAGVARAFGRDVVGHPVLLQMLRDYFKSDTLTPAQARLGDLPQGARLMTGPGLRYPQVVCENVYIFPGIPSLLREKFEAIQETFREQPFYLRKLRLGVSETDLAPLLNEVVATFATVSIGSYPQEVPNGWEVLLTFESNDEAVLQQAVEQLRRRLPAEAVLAADPA